MRVLFVLIISTISIQAGAEKRGLLARCSNGKTTKVSVFEASSGKARAEVSAKSHGSNVTVTYTNLKVSFAKTPNGPVVYHSPKFLLSLSQKKPKATLTVPELGLSGKELNCIDVR